MNIPTLDFWYFTTWSKDTNPSSKYIEGFKEFIYEDSYDDDDFDDEGLTRTKMSIEQRVRRFL